MRPSIASVCVIELLLVVIPHCAFAQTTPTVAVPGKDYSFTVAASTQNWTDTNLDLQAGEVVQISATEMTGCASQQPDATIEKQNLPIPSAPIGSPIARLHAQGAAPIAIGANTELHIEEASHLYLSVNGGNCAGSFTAKVHVTASPASSQAKAATTPATTADQAKTSQADVLKKELATAAQIFMAGQFGTGASTSATPSNATSGSATTSATPAAVVLKVSNTPLDSSLRKDIDGLPRRVNDQFKNLGDMVNFVLVGSQQQVQSALDAANWHVADTDDKKAVLEAVMQTYEKKDYLSMPMSTLYLFDRRQDFGYEQAEPIAMVASRHHFRLWKAPVTWNGQTVWVGAGTHDIGFAKDQRNGNVTHKIDPNVDGERDNVGDSLQKTGKTKNLSYYLPPNPVQTAKNATGDGYHSDGRILVVSLQ